MKNQANFPNRAGWNTVWTNLSILSFWAGKSNQKCVIQLGGVRIHRSFLTTYGNPNHAHFWHEKRVVKNQHTFCQLLPSCTWLVHLVVAILLSLQSLSNRARLSSSKAIRHNHDAATRLTNKEQGEKGNNIPSGQPTATFLPSQGLGHDHTSPEGPRTKFKGWPTLC